MHHMFFASLIYFMSLNTHAEVTAKSKTEIHSYQGVLEAGKTYKAYWPLRDIVVPSGDTYQVIATAKTQAAAAGDLVTFKVVSAKKTRLATKNFDHVFTCEFLSRETGL